jgi:ABC-type nitrate/sulfonate/bicarbonate transport system permease component
LNSENNNPPNLLRSILTGIGLALLSLVVGTVLDYLLTQGLSQFVLANCSEDCYFRIFNIIFVIVVLGSAAVGLRAGINAYRRNQSQ